MELVCTKSLLSWITNLRYWKVSTPVDNNHEIVKVKLIVTS